ncbi:hypothetical protein [Acinetobacter sp. ANC 3791]|uniref:hypothetical protein n=1 Tax=Acinetobacter sp. ANC 3791 TaxID=2529836 RepID=UPI00103E1848|nr:hypothetical protein [Acinetobacter sp. ANC 3791]TCB83358.1 hypothetical protein E0H90_11555 [Acinetobacter sp. ANC 3791]
MSLITKFKANDKVVFDNPHTPNNLVMNVKRGTYKSAGMNMVTVELPGGLANAFASDLRPATEAEQNAGIRL